MADIVITLPGRINWPDYELELRAAAQGESLNFKVRSLPVNALVGDRCWLVYRGKLRGYMLISGFLRDHTFTCSTTGTVWSGNFIQRAGTFHPCPMDIDLAGFQGYRYLKLLLPSAVFTQLMRHLTALDPGHGTTMAVACQNPEGDSP